MKLRYVPGVTKCRQSIDQLAKEMVKAGLLSAATDPEKLAKRAWLDLDGVNDEWIHNLKVERIPEGGRPAQLNPVAFAALWDGRCLCCARGCCWNDSIPRRTRGPSGELRTELRSTPR